MKDSILINDTIYVVLNSVHDASSGNGEEVVSILEEIKWWAILALIVQTIIIALVVEGYKSRLKKAEMQFSTYNQLQVKSVGEFFVQVSTLNVIIANLKKEEVNGKTSVKSYNRWMEIAKNIKEVYVTNKYLFPSSLHSDVDKYILKVGTTGGKTLYLIEQRKTMNTHFDGLEYIYEIEDHEEFHRISNLIGDFDFAESYEAIRKDGESIRSKIIKKYEGIGDD